MNSYAELGDALIRARKTAGIDEAGRGPLAGPVVAAAVVLDPNQPINGLADSKALKHEIRVSLKNEIQDRSFGWALGLSLIHI